MKPVVIQRFDELYGTLLRDYIQIVSLLGISI